MVDGKSEHAVKAKHDESIKKVFKNYDKVLQKQDAEGGGEKTTVEEKTGTKKPKTDANSMGDEGSEEGNEMEEEKEKVDPKDTSMKARRIQNLFSYLYDVQGKRLERKVDKVENLFYKKPEKFDEFLVESRLEKIRERQKNAHMYKTHI